MPILDIFNALRQRHQIAISHEDLTHGSTQGSMPGSTPGSMPGSAEGSLQEPSPQDTADGDGATSVIPQNLRPLLEHINFAYEGYAERFLSIERRQLHPQLQSLLQDARRRYQNPWNEARRLMHLDAIDALLITVDALQDDVNKLSDEKYLPLRLELIARYETSKHTVVADSPETHSDTLHTSTDSAFLEEASGGPDSSALFILYDWYYGRNLVDHADDIEAIDGIDADAYTPEMIFTINSLEFTPSLLRYKLHNWQVLLSSLRNYLTNSLSEPSPAYVGLMACVWNVMRLCAHIDNFNAVVSSRLESNAPYFVNPKLEQFATMHTETDNLIARGDALVATIRSQHQRLLALIQQQQQDLLQVSLLTSFVYQYEVFFERIATSLQCVKGMGASITAKYQVLLAQQHRDNQARMDADIDALVQGCDALQLSAGTETASSSSSASSSTTASSSSSVSSSSTASRSILATGGASPSRVKRQRSEEESSATPVTARAFLDEPVSVVTSRIDAGAIAAHQHMAHATVSDITDAMAAAGLATPDSPAAAFVPQSPSRAAENYSAGSPRMWSSQSCSPHASPTKGAKRSRVDEHINPLTTAPPCLT